MSETPKHDFLSTPPDPIVSEEKKPLPVWVEISLDRGEVALVDVEDLPLIQDYHWFAFKPPHSKTSYACARPSIPGENRQISIYMHRLIVGAKPGEEVDHGNGNGLDNRRFNIRRCTRQQNQRHKLRLQSTNTSGWKGVHRQRDRWIAVIVVNNRKVYLGSFLTPELAGAAYDEAAYLYFGEFAAPNSLMRDLKEAGVI